MSWLDFENQEKGFERFELTKENVLKNIGKRIVYLTKGSIDKHRGYCSPRYDRLRGMKYSYVLLESDNTLDRRDVIECGIEIGNI